LKEKNEKKMGKMIKHKGVVCIYQKLLISEVDEQIYAAARPGTKLG